MHVMDEGRYKLQYWNFVGWMWGRWRRRRREMQVSSLAEEEMRGKKEEI
jgi:hypothetical protein